jgi:hypothetical protein
LAYAFTGSRTVDAITIIQTTISRAVAQPAATHFDCPAQGTGLGTNESNATNEFTPKRRLGFLESLPQVATNVCRSDMKYRPRESERPHEKVWSEMDRFFI